MNAQTAFFLFIAVIVIAVMVVRKLPPAQAGDTAITAAINEALAREFPLGKADIDVKTFDGVVILGGHTREYDQIKRVVEIASAIPGVQSVDNRMSVRSGN